MRTPNFQHLLYFYVVAKEGGIAAAGKALHLSHPTLSEQVKALEEWFGEKLFSRQGRRIVLTETGRLAYDYAEQIFSLGQEMVEAIQGQATRGPLRLRVGILDSVPKLIARALLKPAFELQEEVLLRCSEGHFDELLVQLSQHTLDLVLANAPAPTDAPAKVFTHFLGESGVTLFAELSLAHRLAADFPRSLHQAPFLMPGTQVPLHRSLNDWFSRHGIRPRVVGEFDDTALLKVFGADGVGVFPAPSVVEQEVTDQYRVSRVGRIPELTERYYAISAARRLKNAAVVAVTRAARHELFNPKRQALPPAAAASKPV
ncbi:MAG: transcriptional activator NhaR [Myxococcaceae bacterium]